MALTRWKLRRTIATVNQTLAVLLLNKHPDKTSIGRTTAGFDFLGYHLCLTEGAGAAETDPPPLPLQASSGACRRRDAAPRALEYTCINPGCQAPDQFTHPMQV